MITNSEKLFIDNRDSALRMALSWTHGDSDSAEDLVSTAFVKAAETIHSYDQTRPFLAWFSEIMHNCLIDEARKKVREDQSVRRMSAQLKRKIETQDASRIALENADRLRSNLMEAIESAINSLPKKEKDVVKMWLELANNGAPTYVEIAQLLGIQPATVSKRFAKAVDQLREILA